MLFYEIALKYLEKDKMDLSPYSARPYYWNLKKISDFMPNLGLKELNVEIVQEYKRHLHQIGNSSATINKALSVFRIFTNKMVVDGLVEKIPLTK